jgi:hypothetical protein
MDKSLQAVFSKHFAKLESIKPRKRMKVGRNYLVEEAGQGRIVCLEEGDSLAVIHVFATHKEYEKWYRGRG